MGILKALMTIVDLFPACVLQPTSASSWQRVLIAWSHRSYKAKLPLRIFLAAANSMAFQVKWMVFSELGIEYRWQCVDRVTLTSVLGLFRPQVLLVCFKFLISWGFSYSKNVPSGFCAPRHTDLWRRKGAPPLESMLWTHPQSPSRLPCLNQGPSSVLNMLCIDHIWSSRYPIS
jgi:hypothetical protein